MSVADALNTKKVIAVPPQLKDDGDFTGLAAVDTAGWGYAEFMFIVGATDTAIGSTAEGNAVKLEHCDTSGGSYVDLTGHALADAIADDEDDKIFQIDVDLA